MNWSDELTAELPVGEYTVTSTVPEAEAGGAIAVMDVSELTVKDAAGTVPNSTWLAPVKPLPVTVTLVPPAVLPLVVPSDVTAGAFAAL